MAPNFGQQAALRHNSDTCQCRCGGNPQSMMYSSVARSLDIMLFDSVRSIVELAGVPHLPPMEQSVPWLLGLGALSKHSSFWLWYQHKYHSSDLEPLALHVY